MPLGPYLSDNNFNEEDYDNFKELVLKRANIGNLYLLNYKYQYVVEKNAPVKFGFDFMTEIVDGTNRYEHRLVNVNEDNINEDRLFKNDRLILINGIDASCLNYFQVKSLLANSASENNEDFVIIDMIICRKREILQINESSDAFEEVLKVDDYLTKEELLKRTNEPFWVNLRRIFLIGSCALVGCLILLMIIIVYLNPRCEPLPTVSWWKRSVIFKVNLEEFQEDICANNKTCVPLQVLANKVLLFKDLKADAICLSNLNELSKGFKDLNQNYGTIDDFKSLLETFHSDNIKVLIDFIPNYTFDDHDWFKMSLNNEKYFNYYVWTKTPNNWKNIENQSAWTKLNDYYYLHQYEKNKPDLNYRNEEVYKYLLDSIKYWLDIGVDGFNMITVSRLLEDPLLRDESSSNKNYEYTRNQRDTLYLIAEIRHIVKTYNNSKSLERILVLDNHDTEGLEDASLYYGSDEIEGFDLIMNQLDFTPKNQLPASIESILNKSKMRHRSPLWLVRRNDEDRITQILGTYLQGSSIFNFNAQEISNNTDHKFIKQLLTLKSKLKAVQIGNLKFLNNSRIPTDLIVFKRFFPPERHVLVIINSGQDPVNLKILDNNDLNDLKLNNVIMSIDYVYQSNSESVISDLNEFSLPADQIIPSKSGFIMSWAYKPPDLKDYL